MIVTLHELPVIRRNADKKIILATGTFDLFHYEHLRYLRDAKSQGDILVVAVKNDKCARLKGPDRPIIAEEQRLAIVDAIRYVNFSLLVDYDESIQPNLAYDSEKQRRWLVMFEEVFKSLEPDALFYENNPELQKARESIFAKYNVEGIVKERIETVSTSRIIAKLADGLQ